MVESEIIVRKHIIGKEVWVISRLYFRCILKSLLREFDSFKDLYSFWLKKETFIVIQYLFTYLHLNSRKKQNELEFGKKAIPTGKLLNCCTKSEEHIKYSTISSYLHSEIISPCNIFSNPPFTNRYSC